MHACTHLCDLSRAAFSAPAQLLALALGTQKLAQQRRGAATLPTADGSVMTVFLPHLQEHITSSLLDEEDDEEEGGGAAAGAGSRDPCSLQGAEPMRAQLAQPMAGDALKRKVALAYVVQRLEKGDLASAAPVLAAAVDAISDSSPALQSEGARRGRWGERAAAAGGNP